MPIATAAASPARRQRAASWTSRRSHGPTEWIERHAHHHHRFDEPRHGPGAEVEASRGCPYSCSFCAKIDYRDAYRRRDLPRLLDEIDRLIGQGVTYLYFIDEIFLPQVQLLEALAQRKVSFGVQTRIDLWKPELLALLGRAGCVSIEAGIESLTEEGRAALAKRCRLDTEDLAQLLLTARRHVPFVQANLIGMEQDNQALVAYWRDRLIGGGVWANEPVPLYPYPSSPAYRALWGEPDDACMGTRPRTLSRGLHRIQRHPGRASGAAGATGGRMLRDSVNRPQRILMTIDAVGGLWRYGVDLARGLAAQGIACVLVGFGPEPRRTAG